MKTKATAIIFLAFTILVAFANIPLGHYQYFIFIVPFIVACTTPARAGRIAEFIGLAIIGLYILVIEQEYAGMFILYGAGCLLFTAPHSTHRQSLAYIAVSTLTIAIASYFSTTSKSPISHALLDGMLYFVGTFTLFIMIRNAIDQYRHKAKDIGEKYLDIIDELQKLAHDSINLLKHTIKDKADD